MIAYYGPIGYGNISIEIYGILLYITFNYEASPAVVFNVGPDFSVDKRGV